MATRTLADLVKERYGVNTFSRDNPVVAAVGVTAIPIARQNPNRIWLTIVNLSANVLYVGPFADVAATKGIYLGANGGSLTINYLDDMELPGREWSAIATGAASAILVVEQLTQRDPSSV
jgi:hypothetical protein